MAEVIANADFSQAGEGLAVSSETKTRQRPVAIWLFVMAGLVLTMILVGGATRLTESGLSMTDWHPIHGVIPPQTEAEWNREFEAYKAYPEYQKINRGMSLSAFKAIFWWEYAHRILGRCIGIAFFVPMVFFWWSGRLQGIRGRVLVLFALGGAQGLLGWYMVQSGLVDRPSVSQYRLTAHLSLAVLLFSALFWSALDVMRLPVWHEKETLAHRVRGWSLVLLIGFAIQIVLGGFVAGMDGGLAATDWPKMLGAWLPSGLYPVDLSWRAGFELPLTAQFQHRIGAYVLVLLTAIAFWRLWGRGAGRALKMSVLTITTLVALQVLLGILTVLHFVPVGLGVAHQGTAILLLGSTLFLHHRARAALNASM
ncbi:MAG: COX15/CtaA family protein [Pseudomonadota bacterium]